MTEYAIQAQNVVKKFGDFTAINNITLNVPVPDDVMTDSQLADSITVQRQPAVALTTIALLFNWKDRMPWRWTPVTTSVTSARSRGSSRRVRTSSSAEASSVPPALTADSTWKAATRAGAIMALA